MRQGIRNPIAPRELGEGDTNQTEASWRTQIDKKIIPRVNSYPRRSRI